MMTRKRIRALSAGTTLLMLLLVFSAFSASVFAQVRGPGNRVCAIEDNGNYLSDTQESVVLKAAKELSARRNINVILVTDEEKPDGYVNDDSGSEAYAADIYAKYTGARQSDQDDVSGFLFLLDMDGRIPMKISPTAFLQLLPATSDFIGIRQVLSRVRKIWMRQNGNRY